MGSMERRHGSNDNQTVGSGNDVSQSHASSSTSGRRGRSCFCGVRTILLTVRKGNNAGRQFWRCPFWMTPDFYVGCLNGLMKKIVWTNLNMMLLQLL
ncbi:hypothetical protein TSUD_219440 [Trifolium subterraneum]|uniref:GRF-type domain-containing protein n=1 Tax=Trifolium subterraneum TaxID=3900 RepID=A0A2Z6N5R6_TRISU|nr:hypothetical protein TSUD_219440 [Trifolium subterraneum]